MALKYQPTKIDETLRIVCPSDDAIDPQTPPEQLDRYFGLRGCEPEFDAELLQFVGEPTWIDVRALSRREQATCALAGEDAVYQYVRLGVVDATDWPTRLYRVKLAGSMALADECVSWLAYVDAAFIARAVLEASSLPFASAERSGSARTKANGTSPTPTGTAGSRAAAGATTH